MISELARRVCSRSARNATMSAQDVLKLQLEDLRKNSTRTAYKLASPQNRRHTAGDGHDFKKFDTMVRSSYAPLLNFDAYRYRRLTSTESGRVFFEVSLLVGGHETATYRFSLSQQKEADCDRSLDPYVLPNDSGYWRTDSVTLVRRARRA